MSITLNRIYHKNSETTTQPHLSSHMIGEENKNKSINYKTGGYY